MLRAAQSSCLETFPRLLLPSSNRIVLPQFCRCHARPLTPLSTSIRYWTRPAPCKTWIMLLSDSLMFWFHNESCFQGLSTINGRNRWLLNEVNISTYAHLNIWLSDWNIHQEELQEQSESWAVTFGLIDEDLTVDCWKWLLEINQCQRSSCPHRNTTPYRQQSLNPD